MTKRPSKPIFEKVAICLSVISLAYLLLVTAFFQVYQDEQFYINQYEKNGAATTLGKENATAITENLLTYLNTEKYVYEDKGKLTYFTESEKSHLADVKQIFNILSDLYYLSLLIVTFSIIWLITQTKRWQHSLATILFYGGIISIAFILLLLLAVALNFDKAFLTFHELLFPQGNYSFPHDSLLKTLYPDTFFVSFTYRIIFYVVLSSILATFAGFTWKKHLKKKST
ncbi:hypothetical protein CMO92_02745 [Candidatus Woesearchaeota archaeon]|nr:hypothetical protein [Candidatus Woesearchaeota archaeon]|tara:strand:- start:486 stop:1169 length:684 start_codon:yes stop_codon:yes gene_type:complete